MDEDTAFDFEEEGDLGQAPSVPMPGFPGAGFATGPSGEQGAYDSQANGDAHGDAYMSDAPQLQKEQGAQPQEGAAAMQTSPFTAGMQQQPPQQLQQQHMPQQQQQQQPPQPYQQSLHQQPGPPGRPAPPPGPRPPAGPPPAQPAQPAQPQQQQQQQQQQQPGSDGGQMQPQQGPPMGAVPSAALQEAAQSGAKVYIANLYWWTTDQEVENMCKEYGEVLSMEFLIERSNGKSKGVVLVEFATPETALTAREALNGYMYQGRQLAVTFQVAGPGTRPGPPFPAMTVEGLAARGGRGGQGPGGMGMGRGAGWGRGGQGGRGGFQGGRGFQGQMGMGMDGSSMPMMMGGPMPGPMGMMPGPMMQPGMGMMPGMQPMMPPGMQPMQQM